VEDYFQVGETRVSAGLRTPNWDSRSKSPGALGQILAEAVCSAELSTGRGNRAGSTCLKQGQLQVSSEKRANKKDPTSSSCWDSQNKQHARFGSQHRNWAN